MVKMVKNDKIAPEKVPQSARLSAGHSEAILELFK